ncbi:MAG: hypothetical protein ACR2Q3_10555 [Woeseiaceae bacterium]
MLNDFEVTFEGDYVRVVSNGEKDLEFATKVWTEAVRVCEANQCYRVFGLASTTTPMEALDAYDHGRLFRDLGLDSRFRVAWVETNPEAVDITSFIETVLFNRGLPGKLFDNESEALDWLKSDIGVPS